MDKELLIEKLSIKELSEDQLKEIEAVLNGELTDNSILKKAIELLIPILNNRPGLKFRYFIVSMFVGLIIFLSWRFPESQTQIWTAVGTLLGFVFGQGSQLLK